MSLSLHSTMMTTGFPSPPPPLYTRGGNAVPADRPSTPVDSRHAFISPAQTPQGSPSKHRAPPGAVDLPNAFDKALKLTPSSPTRAALNGSLNPSQLSPAKSMASMSDNVSLAESVIHQPPGSPGRKMNKENRPPSPTRAKKDFGGQGNPNVAALSRQEPYQPREETLGKRQVHLRGVTPEELEKAQDPSVKRLVNVTQLCTCILFFCLSFIADTCRKRQTSSIITSTS